MYSNSCIIEDMFSPDENPADPLYMFPHGLVGFAISCSSATVKFIFQPAEEGAPEGEEGGAALMVKEGVLENPKVDVIFGLHISADTEIGKINYRPKGAMASSDWFKIKIKGNIIALQSANNPKTPPAKK